MNMRRVDVSRAAGGPVATCQKINRSHTHTPTENNTHDTDTHTHEKNNTPNPHEHLPQTLNNARRWRDDGACHLRVNPRRYPYGIGREQPGAQTGRRGGVSAPRRALRTIYIYIYIYIYI